MITRVSRTSTQCHRICILVTILLCLIAKNTQAWTVIDIRNNFTPVMNQCRKNSRTERTLEGNNKDMINMKSFGSTVCNEFCVEYKSMARNVVVTIASVIILTCPITMDINLNWNSNTKAKTISNINWNGPNIQHRHLPAFTCFIQASRQEALAISLTENQRFVSDVWFAVTAQYFDPTVSSDNSYFDLFIFIVIDLFHILV